MNLLTCWSRNDDAISLNGRDQVVIHIELEVTNERASTSTDDNLIERDHLDLLASIFHGAARTRLAVREVATISSRRGIGASLLKQATRERFGNKVVSDGALQPVPE